MAGTTEGGKRAVITNKERYGNDFYVEIGAKGGKAGTTGGFYADPDKARTVGSIGGKRSKRGYRFLWEDTVGSYYQHLASGDVVVFRHGA